MDKIKEQVDQWLDMPVIQYDCDNMEEILDTCIECTNIGLTLIDKSSKDSFLICLTTEDRIYTLDSELEEHIAFFERLLKEQDSSNIKFYIYNGCESTFRLRKGYGINIGNSMDLSALDVFLSMRESVASDSLSTYTIRSLNEQGFPFRTLKKLEKYHLDIQLPEPTYEEEHSLIGATLNSDAKNLIRKMASTTRAIALRILERIDQLNFKESDIIYSFGMLATEEDFEVFEDQEKKTFLRMVTQFDGFQHDMD